ncbi:MAG: Imm61 family immunity protein [Segniliparus sp.]|uniref:Imm61 family immunity protein n=1 Tax=Segniliparus sp. TaxID=2804064 RepID=UPI003F40D026
MDGACLSEKFLAWTARAGWVTSRFDDEGAFDDAGNCAIWQEDAEGRTVTSYLLHARDDDWFDVASGDTRQAMFEARDLEAVERYFWGFLAGAIRKKTGLPELAAPARPAAGYRIENGLVDPSGAVVARGDEQCLVALSHYLAPTLETLEAALLHPEGKPLFTTKG